MISSLVVTLKNDLRALPHTLSDLKSHAAIEVGQQFENRLPATVAATDDGEMMAITRWIEELPEVAKVDVVFVHFENEANELPATSRVVEQPIDSIEVPQ